MVDVRLNFTKVIMNGPKLRHCVWNSMESMNWEAKNLETVGAHEGSLPLKAL